MSALCGLGLPLALDDDFGHGGALGVRLQRHRLRPGEQGDVVVLERRADGDHLGVRLGVDQAGKAVAVLAADAAAVRHVALVEQDAAGRVERPVAGGGEIVGELLRSAARGRPRGTGTERWREARSGPPLARRGPGRAARPGVVRLHLLVGDRPGGRDPVRVPDLAEVLRPQAVERRAEHLGGAADEVVDLRGEGLPLGVVPRSPKRCSGRRRRRPGRASSAARAAASRRAPAGGPSSRRAPADARACRRRRRCRSRSRRSRLTSRTPAGGAPPR